MFLMLGNLDELVTSTLLFNKSLNEVSESPKIQDSCQSCPINMVTKIACYIINYFGAASIAINMPKQIVFNSHVGLYGK